MLSTNETDTVKFKAPEGGTTGGYFRYKIMAIGVDLGKSWAQLSSAIILNDVLNRDNYPA